MSAGYALDQMRCGRTLIRVMDRDATFVFNVSMRNFERMLQRWTEAEMAAVTWRMCHPAGGQPHVEFLGTQLKEVARRWYGDLLGEVAREQRRLPRL
jgi:hypothetical protein